jgi:hypothetical protein
MHSMVAFVGALRTMAKRANIRMNGWNPWPTKSPEIVSILIPRGRLRDVQPKYCAQNHWQLLNCSGGFGQSDKRRDIIATDTWPDFPTL